MKISLVSVNEDFFTNLSESENYMDKSLNYSRDEIKNSIVKFFDSLKEEENMRKFKK
jgi:hypothetical protein